MNPLHSFLAFFVVVSLVRASTVSSPTIALKTNIDKAAADCLAFLQTELAATSSAQQAIVKLLSQNHLIPLGQIPRSLSHHRRTGDESTKASTAKSRIVVSDESNNIECRISLGRAPIGAKCVSPCGCIGSQKWIQFMELNRLRRKDPSQWTVCQTCQQKFEYDIFSNYGGLSSSLVGLALDNKSILRGALLCVSTVLIYSLSIGSWVLRFLLSRPFWQMHTHWSKVTNLNFPLKIWLGKIVFQYIADYYMVFESNVFLSYLIDLETALIDKNLPVEAMESEYDIGTEAESDDDEMEEEDDLEDSSDGDE
jgi:hypothetical protein